MRVAIRLLASLALAGAIGCTGQIDHGATGSEPSAQPSARGPKTGTPPSRTLARPRSAPAACGTADIIGPALLGRLTETEYDTTVAAMLGDSRRRPSASRPTAVA